MRTPKKLANVRCAIDFEYSVKVVGNRGLVIMTMYDSAYSQYPSGQKKDQHGTSVHGTARSPCIMHIGSRLVFP